MEYNKLVRDKIPEIIRLSGGNPITHIASRDELTMMLAGKLYEEVAEFAKSWKLEELADIVEVTRRLAEFIGSSPEQLEYERQKKAEEKGGFSQGTILERD